MVTYEFIISSAGAQKAHDPIREALRRKLRAITEPILRQRIQPFVWASYPKAGAVCHSMIRRYLEHERRSHDTHWDIPSYVSVVVSLDSTNLDFEGGFFVTTGNGEKSFIPLQKGDTVVHQSDLLHGVHVVSGERWSWAMWFQDSSDCSSAAENWWQELQLCLGKTMFFFSTMDRIHLKVFRWCVESFPPKKVYFHIFPFFFVSKLSTLHLFFPGWSRERRSGGTDLACHACKHCRRKLEMVETSCREWFSTSTALLWQSLRRWLSSKTSTTRSCRVVWEITAQWGSGCLLLGPFWHLSFAKWRKVAVVWPTKATDDLLIVEIFITSNNNQNRLYHRPTKLQGFYLGLWEQKRGNVSGAMKLFEQGAHFGDGKVQYWRRLGKGVYEIRYNVQ